MIRKIKNRFNAFRIFICILVIIFILFLFIDFREFINNNQYLHLLKSNIIYFIKAIKVIFPMVVAIIIAYLISNFTSQKWIIKIEKLDIGGASIVFEKPEELFKQQIKNYLNTKRTLFSYDPQRDNIEDTLNSYYKVYNYIREKMQVYDTKSSQISDSYKVANLMIGTLNEFLTSYQSNYRRWIKYRLENKATDNDYAKSISEIQREYSNYDNLLQGFEEVNNKFKIYAKEFNVDIQKWE